MAGRRAARRTALVLLYQWDVTGQELASLHEGEVDDYSRELAEAVIEVTGSKSEIVYEALPTDDPKVRQPDITLAKEILGWEPEVGLREGLRRTIEQAGVETLVGAGT